MAFANVPAEWRPCNRFPGYEVSSDGEVRSVRKTLTVCEHSLGYRFVTMRRDGKTFKAYVHRLVAEAFLPRPSEDHEVDHINGIRGDNRAANLQWLTHAENMNRKKAMGTWGRPTKTGARMTLEKAMEVHRMHAAGHKSPAIAAALQINSGTVWWIRTGKSWKHALEAWRKENSHGTNLAA